MSDWGRNRSGNYHYQAVPRAPMRNQNRKPPPGGCSQPTVPLWEKNFCTKVCRVPWGRIMEAHKVMYMFRNVMEWDDWASEEAFHNAKGRYWAEINNLPCTVSLPDPNLYIDKVDWNCKIDPELLLDLEREPEVQVVEEKTGLAADTLYLMNQPVECSGWGDIDEPVRDNPSSGALLGDCDKKAGNQDNQWGNGYGGSDRNGNKKCNPWEDNNDKEDPWEQGNSDGKPRLVPNSWREASWSTPQSKNNGSAHWGNSNNGWEDYTNGWDYTDSGRQWNENWRKRESDGQYLSRYKTTRYQGDDYHTDHGWRQGRGRKRVSFAQENPQMDKKPLAPRQWNHMHTCGPTTHRRPGNSWGVERQF